jgi:hypothetical protein
MFKKGLEAHSLPPYMSKIEGNAWYTDEPDQNKGALNTIPVRTDWSKNTGKPEEPTLADLLERVYYQDCQAARHCDCLL